MVNQEAEGRIFHVEDNKDFTIKLNEYLQTHGSSIVLFTTTVKGAASMIPERLIEAGVNLAIIDGFLPDGQGQEVAELIRAAKPQIPIIALTGEETSWGDLNVCKIEGPRKLLEAITSALHNLPTQ